MRKSKLEAAETRRRIVATAAEEFRRRGIAGAGVSEVMAAAGLTHGGFYRHFNSKDQLVGEAIAAAADSVAQAMSTAVSLDGAGSGLKAATTAYLSRKHRDDPAFGCPLASLGSEIARSDGPTRQAATDGFLRLVDLLAAQAGKPHSEAAKRKAIVALATMIGALTLSRVVSDPALSDTILAAAGGQLDRA